MLNQYEMTKFTKCEKLQGANKSKLFKIISFVVAFYVSVQVRWCLE